MDALHLLATIAGLAGVGYATVSSRRTFASFSESRSVALLADLVIFLSLLVILAELLGILALFRPFPFALAGLALALLARRTFRGRTCFSPAGTFGLNANVAVVAGLATLLVILAWSGEIARSLDAGIYLQDSTWYHLPFSAGFIQDGRIGDLQQTDPMKLVAWFYPQNSEVLHAYGMFAAGNEFFSLFLNLGFAMITLVAAWASARRSGRPEWAVMLVAALLLSPTLVLQAGNAPNDVAALAFLAISVALLLEGEARGRPGSFDRPLLVLAGLAAGLAVGTKLTLLVPVAVISIGVILLTSASERRRTIWPWFSAIAATGGFWFVRNLVISGNPLPWLKLGPLSDVAQPHIYPRPANSVVDYLRSPSDFFQYLIPGTDDALGYAWPLLVAGAVAGLILLLAGKRRSLSPVLALAAIAATVAYLFNPISASGDFGSPTGFASNLRYVTPAIYIGLIGLALNLDRFRGRSEAFLGAFSLLALLVTFSSSFSSGTGGLLVAAVLAGSIGAMVAFRLASGLKARLALVLAVSFIVITTGSIAFSGYSAHRYEADRIPVDRLAGFRSTEEWGKLQEWGLLESDQTIAIVGPAATFGQFPFYGEDLSNRVEYLGIPIAHGGLRPVQSCEELRQRVNEIGPDLVVSTPLRITGRPVDSQEAYWLRDDPKATETIRAAPASVFRIDGRLDPALCYTAQTVQMVPNLWGGSSPVNQDAIPAPD